MAAVNIIGFVVSAILFFGGILLMGYSFEPIALELPFGVDPRIFVFSGGLLATTAGLMIPVHIMKRIDA